MAEMGHERRISHVRFSPELFNPEKSLIATIESDGAGEPGRSFRYASLASGLEIVRKTLSQHAIAAGQTTVIGGREFLRTRRGPDFRRIGFPGIPHWGPRNRSERARRQAVDVW